MSECEHGDDASTCPPCRRATGRDAPIAEAPPEVAFHFTARYEGDCTACHLPIYVGQRCAQMTNGRNVHTDCA